ncbi:Enterochelin esterase [Nonomuraea jiangxiensis]|uniref:Enterochelin esterase n=1 Tax=Nonomuraea jiangxiensis TaxID=633440 RepID=A0A1G8S7Q8_9ACTN|nr:Enterochelin esterase [Nonomuraea jiangxiensis]
MPVANPRPSSRSRRRGRLRSVLAGLTIAAGVATVALAAPASAAPAAPLGPSVVKTDAPPSGYAVKFRYQAPAGVNAVHVYGDWFFSRPENVQCADCGDGRPPSEWQPGDIQATPWRILPMEKGADGVWEITVPLPAGTFRYAFTHDCTSPVATGCALYDDPANRWEVPPPYPDAPGAVRSRVYVPVSKKFPTYDTGYQAPVSAGKLGKLEPRRYPSPLSTNPAGVHDIVVYTPHGYDPNRATPYPTLYLSHGSGDHSTAWTMQGVAHHILENAIRDGAAQPMVVVSTDFNGLPGGNQGYADELRNNVIPFVEQNYHVSTRSRDRAFGGFSAGGSRAFTIMYDNTDLFAYHAAWSSGGPAASQAQIDRLKAVPGGIYIGTGLQDRLGNIAQNSQLRAAALKAAGVNVTEHNVDGVHTWHVWRPLLNFYLRNLAFRTTTTGVDVNAEPAGESGKVRLTATATVDGVTANVASPKGKVEFYAGDAYLGSAPVTNGVATFDKAVDGALLDNPVVARYQGDKLFNASQSAQVDAG